MRNKTEYKIPITWQAVKTYRVGADNLQDAVKKALKAFFDDSSIGEGYIEDSFEVDEIIEDEYPEETIDWNKL